MPVARDVLRHAQDAPGRVALALGSPSAGPGGGDVTYGELARRVVSATTRLGPLAPRGVVALVPAPRENGPEHGRAAVRWADTLVALLAVDLGGGIPLVCDDTWGAEHRADVVAGVHPDRQVSVAELCAGGDDAPSRRTDDPAPPPAELPAHPVRRPDDLAWAGFTSGSTGRPRAVVRSRASWTASFDAVDSFSGTTTESVVLVPGDLATSLYCFGAVHALAGGATVRPAPVRADLGPAALASDVLHVTPAQLEAVLDTLEAEHHRDGAPGLPAPGPTSREPSRTALVGGAGLSAATRRRAERAGVHVVAYYGAAELSFVAVDTDGTGLRPFPGAEIDVRVDGADRYGTVWVRSPWLAAGYLAGVSGPLRVSDGWATVGDLAEPRTPNGPLVLRGRGTGAITVGAATVLPEDVEAVLAAADEVTDVVVLGSPHPRWGQVVTAVVVLAGESAGPAHEDEDEDAALLARLERLCRDELAPAQRPRRWFVAPSLPRTGGGKVARADVTEALAGYRRLRRDPQR